MLYKKCCVEQVHHGKAQTDIKAVATREMTSTDSLTVCLPDMLYPMLCIKHGFRLYSIYYIMAYPFERLL